MIQQEQMKEPQVESKGTPGTDMPTQFQDMPEVTPEQEQKTNAYVQGLSRLLHSKDTKPQIYEMLKVGDPMSTIPQTALTINDQMESAFKQKGTEPDLDTLIAGAQFLISDLIEIGNAGGFFELNKEDPQVMGPLLTNTMQPWIEKHLADGSLDPVELQEKVEPLMAPKSIESGQQVAADNGLSNVAGEAQARARSRQMGVLEGTKKSKEESAKAIRTQATPENTVQTQRGVMNG